VFAVPRRTIHLYPGILRDVLEAARDTPAAARARIAAFEDGFARHLGSPNVAAVGSGRLGLKLLLQGLGVGPGHKVAVPAFTDQSVPMAVRRAGAEPVYVDVDRGSFNLDPNHLETVIQDPAVRAVIALHIFGAPCDLPAIETIVARRGLPLLEDCAHAIDASSGGRMCGTIGVGAIFSFVVTKAINAFGGGMVATQNAELGDYVRRAVAELPLPEAAGLARRIAAGMALHTATRPDVFTWLLRPALTALEAAGGDVITAYNKLARPSTINAHVERAFSPVQAAVALPQLRQLATTQAARRDAADRIRAVLPDWLTPQTLRAGDEHAYYFFSATADNPERAASLLSRHGIDVGRFPMRNVAALDDPTEGPRRFPNAQWVYEHALQIPVHPTLGPVAVQRMVDAMRSLKDSEDS
jgi:perosamine synthetase